MLVRLPQPLVISEYFNYDRFGEIVLGLPLDGESRLITPTAIESPGAAANARALANSLRRITLDDAVSAQNPATLRHPNGTPFSLGNPLQAESLSTDYISPAERNIFLFILVYLLVSSYQFGLSLSKMILYPPDREAMTRVQKNTPASSRFLVLSGESFAFCDAVSEWFPALAQRSNLTTIQGTEWTQGANFPNYVKSTVDVQGCLSSDDDACLAKTVNPSAYDYIYLKKKIHSSNCMPVGTAVKYPYFVEQLRKNADFQAVFETEDVIIFGK